jgi:hypothetical protein
LNCWILDWLTCSDNLGAQLFCTILWKFWFHRNQVVFKNSALDPVRLAQDAMRMFTSLKRLTKLSDLFKLLPGDGPPLLTSL